MARRFKGYGAKGRALKGYYFIRRAGERLDDGATVAQLQALVNSSDMIMMEHITEVSGDPSISNEKKNSFGDYFTVEMSNSGMLLDANITPDEQDEIIDLCLEDAVDIFFIEVNSANELLVGTESRYKYIYAVNATASQRGALSDTQDFVIDYKFDASETDSFYRQKFAQVQPATPATSGTFTTSDISANVAAIIAVTDGEISVSTDGVKNIATGIDFTSETTLDGIASVLQTEFPACVVEAVGTSIVLTSQTTGIASTVTPSTVVGTGTDISALAMLDIANGTAVAGTAAVA